MNRYSATSASRLTLAITVLLIGAATRLTAEPRITTAIGTGLASISKVQGPTTTNVGQPFGVEVGPEGDVYVCEVKNHRVWRWSPAAQTLEVVAGCGQMGYSGDGGPAVKARLNEPYEVRFDTAGNLYFVEMRNHLVRRVDATTGTITTVAGMGKPGFTGDGGPAVEARLQQPHSIALDPQTGRLMIADIGNHRIRVVDLATGLIDTFAGNGRKRLPIDGQVATDTPVLGPRALYITDRTLWVALREGHSVWQLDLDQPVWRHVAGTGDRGFSGDDGPATQATLNGPKGIAVGPRGDIYVVDTENQVIRRIDRQTKTITTLAGSGPHKRGFGGDDGPATLAQLNRPHGICVTQDGAVLIGDTENHRVRMVDER